MRKLTQGLVIGLGAAAVAWMLWWTGWLRWIEFPAWDWRANTFAAPCPETGKVRLILLDQTSLDWGQKEQSWSWPWPRIAYGAIADFCARAGARAVIFDMVFTEPSIWNRIYGDDDAPFGASLAAAPNTVVGFELSRNQGSVTKWPEGLPRVEASGLSEYAAGHPNVSLSMPLATFPVPEIATACSLLGNVFGTTDKDNVIRRLLPFQIFDSTFVPSLGLAGYLAANPSETVLLSRNELRIGSRTIPLDDSGQVILHYRRGPDTRQAYTTVSAQAVIQSEVRLQEGNTDTVLNPDDFRGSYVLVGSSAPGLMDLRATPISRALPGVEIHATFLDNLLSDDFIRDAPLALVMAGTLVFALLGALIGRSCQKGWQAVLAFVILPPLPLIPGFAGYHLGYWFPIAPPVVALALALVSALILNYTIEGKQRRFIKSAFSQYLSPAFIERLVQDPSHLKLGGESRELSIYFSDIQGFTTISETLAPQDLTAFLNEYLTAMTDIIMEEGGTVDKYEGDAVIAFWNAPVDLPEHARCAVRAALRCQKKMTELRPALKARFGKEIFCRIGVNTGTVVIGNMGSHQRFNYTFLGDAGNLASRLEGANKQFGTFIMISEFTRAMIGDEFPVRELSRILVKGKNKPVCVFEPMLPEDFARRREALDVFAAALSAYYEGRFGDALNGFSKIAEQDAAARSYLQRCRELMENPPEAWSGVWELTEK
ncbi:MAG: adenylate/guanylate cyclase domain-containing protein [Thermodesulfobacteriota bacterium]